MSLYVNIKTTQGRFYKVKIPSEFLTKDGKLMAVSRSHGSKYQKWKAKATRLLNKYGSRNNTDQWWNNLSHKQQKALLLRYRTKEMAQRQYLHLSHLE